MDEREFGERAEIVLSHIESVLEAVDGRLDYELASGGVLELEFGDGSKMVINRHAITREIWVAARSGGFHFRWNDGAWVDTRSGEELMAMLSILVSTQAGVEVRF